MGRDAKNASNALRACEARALHTRRSRLPKTSENDCFAVYQVFKVLIVDIYTTVVKILAKLLWSPCRETEVELVENYFRQELLSQAFDGEIRLGLVCTAAGFRFLSPALKWHYQKTHFQWNHWERLTAVVVPSKAARCRTAWSDLCPAMDLLCLVLQLWSESTVTDVALRQWFVRCGSIPARFDISFIVLSSSQWQNQLLVFYYYCYNMNVRSISNVLVS